MSLLYSTLAIGLAPIHPSWGFAVHSGQQPQAAQRWSCPPYCPCQNASVGLTGGPSWLYWSPAMDMYAQELLVGTAGPKAWFTSCCLIGSSGSQAGSPSLCIAEIGGDEPGTKWVSHLHCLAQVHEHLCPLALHHPPRRLSTGLSSQCHVKASPSLALTSA